MGKTSEESPSEVEEGKTSKGQFSWETKALPGRPLPPVFWGRSQKSKNSPSSDKGPPKNIGKPIPNNGPDVEGGPPHILKEILVTKLKKSEMATQTGNQSDCRQRGFEAEPNKPADTSDNVNGEDGNGD